MFAVTSTHNRGERSSSNKHAILFAPTTPSPRIAMEIIEEMQSDFRERRYDRVRSALNLDCVWVQIAY